MERGALWGNNPHSKPANKTSVRDIKDYVALFVPRDMLRSAASKFCDVRHADSKARYDEIQMQLFLQMVYETSNLPREDVPKDLYPYTSAWLQWIPSKNVDGVAVGYIIHAVSFHDDVKFGHALNRMLFESSMLHRDSADRKMNARKVDPLTGLREYQKWMVISGPEMYIRTVADRYAGSQEYTSLLDDILDPKTPLYHPNNLANPKWVFSIDRALAHLPDTTEESLCQRENYTGQPAGPDGALIPVTELQFPTQDHVIRLTPAQLHPKIFCSKYLPEHQLWMEQQKDLPEKPLGDHYDSLCETEYDIRTSADIERARLDGMADRSAFASLAYQSKIRYAKDVMPYEHVPEVFREKYGAFQKWGIEALRTQCLDPDACISEVVSKMITWRTQKSKKKIVKHSIKIPSMSVFANRVIFLMEAFEQYYLISTAHRMMYLILHARYDAFRRDFGLHLNCFQAGDGATSKSFLFLLMEKMSIEGTMEVLTYQTGKSDAVDGNRNDIVTVCHEAPPGMFRSAKNPNADSSQEAMFKEKLTSQRVTCKTWCMDESTGKRSARLTKSECVGVWMGATNDSRADVEEALQTRFFWGNFEQVQRRGRDIDDCMNGERMMSTDDKVIRRRLFEEAKEEQYRVMIIEKAIWTKVIKDVDNTASNIIIPIFKDRMAKNSIIRPGPRDWERIKLFARNQAIVTAIETVCNLPGGKHYDKPFEEYMLPDIEPYLKVSEEMVLFTLSLFADQFRSPVEHKILNTIWNMEKSNPTFGNPFDPEDKQSVDYLRLDNRRLLCTKINSRIPLENGRTSQHNIEDFIKKMTKHSFVTHKYKMPGPASGLASDNKFPVKDGKRTKKYDSCVTNDHVWIHVEHILNHASGCSDSVFDTITSISHKYSASKRLISACPLSSKWFHVLKVIDRKPSGKRLHYKNVLSNSKTSRILTNTSENAAASRTRDGYDISMDIDKHVAMKWSKATGKSTKTPTESVSDLFAEDPEQYDIQYPEDLIGEQIDDNEEEEPVNKRKRNEEDNFSVKKLKQ